MTGAHLTPQEYIDQEADAQQTLQLVQTIEQAQAPRIVAVQVLTTRLNILFMVKDIETAEIVLTALTWWFLSLISKASSTSSTYKGLLSSAPLWMWQLGFFAVALLATVSLVTGNRRLRRLTWSLSIGAWFAVTAAVMWLQGFTNVAGLTTILLVSSLWALLRASLAKPVTVDENDPEWDYIDLS